uniref:Cyclodipeptide synthase n=1 Tax=Candidatus Endohaliclona renieramycinifaciens TaxID=2565582 RepID=A0A4D6G3H1_9GAMM|nr:hypothetical protein [Candidatus Endohaliclona renieramycinifaciens]QCC21406.1 hypothetical protein [Candidatus Endohaliclona renieramycinifaciens]QCC21422.1 hypothetical protein [Candidatus Endohaliclona renieramycinifaciens]
MKQDHKKIKIPLDYSTNQSGRNRIKPVFKCKDNSYRASFKHSRCLLTISVGQEIHESDKFSVTVDLINNAFSSCIILVDDTLQRHTMALDSDEDASFFYKSSLEAGDFWLERNYQYYKNLAILEDIVRWDRWLNHPEYFKRETILKNLFQKDPSYRKAFENTIQAFLRRYRRRFLTEDLPSFNTARAHRLCLDYLLEENIALSLWPELNCHFEVYPNQRNLAMSETHKRLVIPDYPTLLHAVSIKFKNRRQFKPQILIHCQSSNNSNKFI